MSTLTDGQEVPRQGVSFISSAQAAFELGVSITSIYNWIKTGKCQAKRRGHRLLIPVSFVRDMKAGNINWSHGLAGRPSNNKGKKRKK